MTKPIVNLQAIAAAGQADTLRFLTCGSVDDGKSTLIGRLLFDSQLLMEDQLAELQSDSKKHGTAGGAIDFALLVDGLEAEREQGITIDVAYRFFATPRRRFIVADTPGHEQYTRNMATGASTADMAVLLVDATKGVLTQTRRHAVIASLLGIRQTVLAVNKMDLIGFDENRFNAIVEDFQGFAADLGFGETQAIPISARDGDNVSAPSDRMPWYEGPSILSHLETVSVADGLTALPFRLPVQWVCRPDQTFRGFAGTIAGGTVEVGQKVVAAASGRGSQVTSLHIGSDPVSQAGAGRSVMLTLADEIDVSRGDLLVAHDARPEMTDQFAAHLIWMASDPLLPGRQYNLKTATRTVSAQVTELKHCLDVDSMEHNAAKVLEMNEIGFANLSTAEPVALDAYDLNRETGSFILIDRFTNETVAAGMVAFSLRRASNIHWQALDVNRIARAGQKHQKPSVLWFTGLSGSGKSTIANIVEKKLFARGRHTYTLDGDNVRHGLNRDLGFTDADRVENIRRVAEAARLMADAGLIVLVSFISPFRSERRLARDLMEEGEFMEVFIDTPIEVCQERDPKGLYAKAIAGEISNFTGIDSPYETPELAEVHLDTTSLSAEEAAETVIAYLEKTGRLSGE
jgi:bifunctional enzyme CysN/CysC